MSRKLWFALLGCLVLPLFVVSCGGGKEVKKVDERDSLIVLRSDQSDKLDPHATSNGGDVSVMTHLYEGLVRASVKPPLRWEPCLAERWEIGEGGKVYTFHLRQGVKFHDGVALDAAAVKKSFERIIQEAHPAAPADRPYVDFFLGIDRIETPGDKTVRFTLKTPDVAFLANCGLFAAGVVSPKAIDEMARIPDPSARTAWLTRHPAGTGPYTIAAEGDYQGPTSIVLTANEGYWGGKPAIRRVVYQSQSEARQRLERIVQGDVQVIDNVLPSDQPQLVEDENVVLNPWDDINLCYLAMNMSAEGGFLTADQRIREAIALAIDRDAIVRSYEGTATPLHVLLPESMPGHPAGYLPKGDELSRDQARAQARELVKAAGAEGKTLTLNYPKDPRGYLPQPDSVADLIRQQIEAVGLKVKLEKTPNAELFEAAGNGRYELVLAGWMTDNGDPDNFWGTLLGGKGGPSTLNYARFWDAEVEAALNRASREPDAAKRAAIYEGLERSVHAKFRPIVPLLTSRRCVAWRADVAGIFVDPLGQLHLREARYKD